MDTKEQPSETNSVYQAIANREPDRVRELLVQGGDANEVDDRGQPALMIALTTDQYLIANELVDYGADIWFADDLGFTPGIFAHTSVITPKHPEYEQREVFIERLKDAGYPWPPPKTSEVEAMQEQGKWPPRPMPVQ